MHHFKGSLMAALAVALLLPAAFALSADTMKVVYYDETYAAVSGGWISPEAAVQLRDHMVGSGYQEVNAEQLRQFMLDRIEDGVRSVIVFAKDTCPDTVCEPTESNAPSPNTILRQYLNAGGRIVWAGDIPFYYMITADQASVGWGDNGAATILGFNAVGIRAF